MVPTERKRARGPHGGAPAPLTTGEPGARVASGLRRGALGAAADSRPRDAVRDRGGDPITMMSTPSAGGWKAALAYGLGALVALPLLVPVLQNIEEGQRLVELGVLSPRDRLRPVGLGPVSGLMLYLIATPIMIALSRTFLRQLLVIAGMVALALTVSHVTSVFERGDQALGLLLTLLSGAALVGLGGALRWRRHQRRQRRMASARALGLLTREAAARSRAVANSHGAVEAVAVVERMALAAIWEAAHADRHTPFTTQVMVALTDLRRDLARNRLLDPDGVGLAMMDRLLPVVRTRLEAERRAGDAES